MVSCFFSNLAQTVLNTVVRSNPVKTQISISQFYAPHPAIPPFTGFTEHDLPSLTKSGPHCLSYSSPTVLSPLTLLQPHGPPYY